MGLLERLRSGASGPRGLGQIAGHLAALLNSEQGYASVIGDFGVPSSVKEGAPPKAREPQDPVERLRRELVKSISRHEPALGDFELHAVSRDPLGHVTFALDGRHAETGAAVHLRLLFDVWTRRFEVMRGRG